MQLVVINLPRRITPNVDLNKGDYFTHPSFLDKNLPQNQIGIGKFEAEYSNSGISFQFYSLSEETEELRFLYNDFINFY